MSDYSGNVDFCDEKSCFLVDGKKVYNKGKDYILSDEFFWFEPDINKAAQHMKDLVLDSTIADHIKENAYHQISTNYSVEACSMRLEKILTSFENQK